MPFYPFTPVSSGGGSVSNVAGGDASIAATNPAGPNVTLVTGTLDVLASLHPAAAAVGLNGQKIINLANGVAGSDGAAFGQLAALLVSPALSGTPTAPTAAPGDTSTQLATDAFVAAAVTAAVQGLAIKPSVQAATTTALPANTYSNGASGVGATLTAVLPGVLVVDGITVALGNRVLVQDEVAAANNGIYVVTTLGTVSVAYILTRAADMNQAAEVPGAFTFVEAGTVNAGAGFTVAGAGPYVIGTTAINWTQFSGAGEVTAGTGLTKTGNTLSLTTPVSIANGGTGQATDPLPSWMASDCGFLAWTSDYGLCTGKQGPGASNIVLSRINVRQAITVATLTMFITTAGSGLTANNVAGLYNSSGTLLGTTADQSTNWATAGPQPMSLTVVGGQSLSLTPGFYWAAIVQHGTPPTWLCDNQTAAIPAEMNIGLTAATARAAFQSGTSLANLTPASNTLYAIALWAALS
jgi:hypothetical protein